MLSQFNSNNEEILFWKVINNRYLFRKIIGFVGYRQHDLDFITSTKKIQFSNITSMSWMIKHGQLELLLDKLKNNQFVKMASKDLKYFFKYYNNGENELFDQLFNLLVKIQDSDGSNVDIDCEDDGSKNGEYQLYNSYRYLRDSKSNCYSNALKYACLKPYIHYSNSRGDGDGNSDHEILQFDYECKESSIKSMVDYFSDNGIKKEYCCLVPFQLLMEFNSMDLKYKILKLGLLVGMNGSDYKMVLILSLSHYKRRVELVLLYLHLIHYYNKTSIPVETLNKINRQDIDDQSKMKLIKYQLIQETNNPELYFDYLKCYNEIIDLPNLQLMAIHYKFIFQWTFSSFNCNGLKYLNSIYNNKPTTPNNYMIEDLVKHYTSYYEKESNSNVVQFLKLYYSLENNVFLEKKKMQLRMVFLFDKVKDLSILDEILQIDSFDFKLLKYENEFQYLKIKPFSKLKWYIENIEKKLPLDQRCTAQFQDNQFQFQVPDEIVDLEYIVENNDQFFKIHEIGQLEIKEYSTIQYLEKHSSKLGISNLSSLLSIFFLDSISNCDIGALKFIHSNPNWSNVDFQITNKQFQESQVFDGCTIDEIKELVGYLVEIRFKSVPWDLILWCLNKLYFEIGFISADILSSIIDFNIVPTVTFSCLVNSIFNNEIIISNQIIEKFKFEWFQIDHQYINNIVPIGFEILNGYHDSDSSFYRNPFKFIEIYSVMKWFTINFEKSIINKTVPFLQRVFNQLYSIMVCCSDITFENIDSVHQLYTSFSIGIMGNSFLHTFYYLDLKSPFLSKYLKYKRSTKVLLDGVQTFDYICELQGTTDSSSIPFLNIVVNRAQSSSSSSAFTYESIKSESIETIFYSMCKLLGFVPTFTHGYSAYLKEDIVYCFENNQFTIIMGILISHIPKPIDHRIFIESFGYIFKYLSIVQVDYILKQTIQHFGGGPEITILVIETAIEKQRLDIIKFIFENYKSDTGVNKITNFTCIYRYNLLDIAHYFFKYQNQSLKLFNSDGEPVVPILLLKSGQPIPQSMENYTLYKGYNQLSQLHLKYYKK